MRPRTLALAFLGVAMLGVPAQAQPGGRGGPPPGAEFFLAQTGELRLTDAQVVRLAAIARRSADRRRAMRAGMDSLRPSRAVRGDSAGRVARAREMEQLRARFERQRELAQADMRDALAVLTAEQQAMAWEMNARGRHGGRAARGSRFRRDDGPGRDRRPRRSDRRSPPAAERPPA